MTDDLVAAVEGMLDDALQDVNLIDIDELQEYSSETDGSNT
jgi:hypothetical protein